MSGAASPELPGIAAIRAAADRLRSHIHRTPLLTLRSLGDRLGCDVRLKAENLQRAGAFKIRGALNALLCARERGELERGRVVTYSSGNHGQAVALAARLLGCRATVVAPTDVLRVKRLAIEGYGAEVICHGLTSEDRRQRAEELARSTGATIVPPYDHPDIIAGQGTAALEILEDFPAAEAILVPVGGGGLIAGIAIAAAAVRPGTRVIGVEPERAADLARSLRAGRKVRIDPPDTIADGLRALEPGDLTFEAARRHVADVLLVSEESIVRAQRALLERAKLLVEPSGAVALAALESHAARIGARSVVLFLSGGNAELPPLPGD